MVRKIPSSYAVRSGLTGVALGTMQVHPVEAGSCSGYTSGAHSRFLVAVGPAILHIWINCYFLLPATTRVSLPEGTADQRGLGAVRRGATWRSVTLRPRLWGSIAGFLLIASVLTFGMAIRVGNGMHHPKWVGSFPSLILHCLTPGLVGAAVIVLFFFKKPR